MTARVVQTNDDTISFEDAASGYKGLMVIERCFRSLKRTRIKMTPMYHWAARRIEAHMKICVLALLRERLAEISCGQSWHRIGQGLEGLQISYFSTAEYTFYRTNELTGKVRNLLNSLKISPPKLIQDIRRFTQNV